MTDFNFKVEEPKIYKKRKISYLKLNALISFGVFALTALSSDWKGCLVLSILIFIILNLNSYRDHKFFITNIIVNDLQVIIRFKEEDNEKEISGNRKDFKLKKRFSINPKHRIPYLAVYFKNDLLIKQFEIGEWNEKTFDKIIEVFKMIDF